MGNTARAEDSLGPILDLVYDAAVDDGKWNAIAPMIASAFGAPSAVFKTCGGDRLPQLESVTDNLQVSPSERAWADYWHQNDLWVERSSRLDMGDVFTSQRLMPDAQFERMAFFQEWTRKLDIYHMVGVLFPIGNGEIGVLGAHRPKTAGHFAEPDRRKLGELFPHVRRALNIRRRFRGADIAAHAALGALEQLETGVVVVDASCRVLFANRAAERILQSEQGIRTRNHRLALNDAQSSRRLSKLAHEATLAPSGSRMPGAAIAVPRAQRLPLTLLVSPWRPQWALADIGQPAALIFIRDPEAYPPGAAQVLVEMFDLTKAEAVIALALGEGQSIAEIAREQQVSVRTVRTHLHQVMVKTGTGRQGAIAVLVGRSIAGLK